MSALKDLTGMRFGRLLVISRAENRDCGLAQWLCRCDCGRELIVRGSTLRNGASKSCGCLKRDRTTERNYRHGSSKRNAHLRLYNVWCGMKQRCLDPEHISYKYYGGRGITICDEWKDSFPAFRDWALANGYDENAPRGVCTLDRINVDGSYGPDNCRWVSMAIQADNKHIKRRTA